MSSLISIKWDKFLTEQRLLSEAQEIYALYEEGLITEADLKKWLRKKGIPLAVAASLGLGGAFGAKAQTDQAWDEYTQQIQHQRDADQEALASYVTPHAYKYKYAEAPWGYGKYAFVPPDQIPDDADLGHEVGERTAGEYRKSLKGHTTNSLEKMLSGRGGQWSLAPQDLDGDGTISDQEAMTLIYDKDKKGRKKLPLKWSLTWEALKNLQDSGSTNESRA